MSLNDLYQKLTVRKRDLKKSLIASNNRALSTSCCDTKLNGAQLQV